MCRKRRDELHGRGTTSAGRADEPPDRLQLGIGKRIRKAAGSEYLLGEPGREGSTLATRRRGAAAFGGVVERDRYGAPFEVRKLGFVRSRFIGSSKLMSDLWPGLERIGRRINLFGSFDGVEKTFSRRLSYFIERSLPSYRDGASSKE